MLFTIDPRPFELMVKQAEAQLAKDSGQSKTQELQRARYANLNKQGLVSQADFDTVSAQANSLQSTLALDQVAIENAKLQLQYTKILAPVAGRTGALQVHVGIARAHGRCDADGRHQSDHARARDLLASGHPICRRFAPDRRVRRS